MNFLFLVIQLDKIAYVNEFDYCIFKKGSKAFRKGTKLSKASKNKNLQK